ncbi:MAG TPA: hypothetical protein PJ988_01945 [Anaerolinea sp.]|nr:hypothetical protein [Anaerolinea sp.]
MYQHLGEYSDWAELAGRQHPLFPHLSPGQETRARIRDLLGFASLPEQAGDVRVERAWVKDGLAGEQISWSVGYGPRTSAWFFKPKGAQSGLPCVLALHDHGGFKYWGKEKIAEGEETALPGMRDWWSHAYGGRAWVNALAREGFAVLVHDTFLWGSRGFSPDTMLKALPEINLPGKWTDGLESDLYPPEAQAYNFLAGHHEHVVEKYCPLLGTCMAGVVAYEDRIALNYLLSRPEVDPVRSACMGLSGGGNRAALLMATAERLSAGVIVGLMSTYPALLDHNVAVHTWMLFPPGLSRIGDWPDLAASRAPTPLLVQYDREDPLFTLEGMREAHARLQAIYADAGADGGYAGQFYDGPHKFDQPMQEQAFTWLKARLG